MYTKMARIEELLHRQSYYSDKDVFNFQIELEAQFKELKEENERYRDRKRKLEVVKKDL